MKHGAHLRPRRLRAQVKTNGRKLSLLNAGVLAERGPEAAGWLKRSKGRPVLATIRSTSLLDHPPPNNTPRCVIWALKVLPQGGGCYLGGGFFVFKKSSNFLHKFCGFYKVFQFFFQTCCLIHINLLFPSCPSYVISFVKNCSYSILILE